MNVNDQKLVENYLSGQRDAFSMLYDRYVGKIYRFVYYKTLHKETAEDIVADVFYKAMDGLHGYHASKGPFSAWIYTIARNAVVDHYRNHRSTSNIDDIFDIPLHERTEERIDAKETLSKIEKYMETLSPRQREIITLRVWDDMSYRDIADIVGGSEESVKMMFLRSIKTIREKFGPMAVIALFALKF